MNAPSFSTLDVTTQLAVSQQLRVDGQLKVGLESETVEVSASEEGVAVNTQNAELSNVVSQRQVTELPLITRNPYDIALSAGTTRSPVRQRNQRGSGAISSLRSQDANFARGENNDTFTSQREQDVPLDSIRNSASDQ